MNNKRKKWRKFIYVFAVLALVMQAFMTTLVTTPVRGEEQKELLTLDQAKATNSSVELDVTVKKSATEDKEEIYYHSNASFKQAVWKSETNKTPITLDKADKSITITAPKDADFKDTIKLTLEKSVSKTEPVQFTYEKQQQETVIPPEHTEKTPATTNDSSTITPEKSALPSKKTQTDQEKKTTEKKEKASRADSEGNDIRSYFSDGDGTILTDVHVVYLDKDGNVLSEPIPADATVRTYYNWEIPENVREQIQPGDYFDFQLPNELKPIKPLEGDLKNEDGEVYAHYTIDTDGNIRFVFNENVTSESDITGDFNFDAEFDTEVITGPGDQTIHFPEEDNLPPIDVIIKPTTDEQISKKGEFDRTPNPTSVKWTVDFNQTMNELANPALTEHFPDDLTYQSAKVYKLIMNLDGTVKEVGEELSPDDYTIDDKGNIKIKGDTNDAYRVVYDTKIDEATIPDEGGKVSFVNTATLSDDKNPEGIDAKASVTNQYGKMIEKSKSGYDPSTQTFSWSIKYNYGEKTIPENQAVITDTMSDNMSLEEDSIAIHTISFDENGKEIKGSELVEGVDYELTPTSDGKFTIKFLHDIDTAIKIDYKTKVDGIVSDPTAVNNKVETDTGESSSEGGTANQQNIIKKLGDIDYSDELASWSLKINQNGYEMNNLVINDTYTPSPGLNMNTVDGNYDFTIKDDTTNQTLTEGTDYDLTIVKDGDGNETGFKVIYKGDYVNTDHKFTVQYKTHFDISILDPNDANNDTFINKAGIDWTDSSDNKHHSEDEADFKPDYSYSLNARKSGEYNAQTKTITWSIAVNLSANELEDAFLKDKVLDNQNYVGDSLKVYEAHTQSNGTVVKDSDIPVNDQMKKVAEPDGANDETFQVDFPDGVNQTYLIEFQTSLADQVIEDSKAYDNVADYSNQGTDRDVNGEVSVKNGGSFIQKDGKPDPDDANYVDWDVVINPSQSTLDNVVITDKPSENQILDKNSIKLYETTVSEDGTVTPNKDKPLKLDEDYTVELTTDNETGKQELQVKMLHKIDTAYYMTYKSFINSSAAGKEDTLTNSISITGEGTKRIEGDDSKEVVVEVDHSGGNANGKKGALTIQKTKANTTQGLAGASFQLWDTAKTQVLREGTVDENGQLKFGGLPQGEYLLVESNAPDGYVIADDLANGRKVKINDASSAETAKYVVPNEMNEVVLTKTNEDGEKLAGAEFKLERLNTLSGLNWESVPLNPNKTDADGKIKVEGLASGLYRMTETKAPTGYMLSSTAQYFIINKNGTVSNNKITNLTKIDYQGSAKLIKKDVEGNPLAGAEFKVIDSTGKTIKTGLKSSDDGTVLATGLAPGNYHFVETKAPSGYILNVSEVPFQIANTANGKPAVVEAEDDLVNYQGSAELTKVNQDGDTLTGAEFKVIDSNGKTVKANLQSDENGKVQVDGLAPGDYKFIETKAPRGYLINTEGAAFTIPEKSQGEPQVVSAGKYVDYRGSFKIEKVNTSGQDIAGAEFTLYSANKEKMDKVETSGKDGKVEFDDLAPGVYYFKETKAPTLADGTDYVINPALHKVEIKGEAKGEPETYDIGDFQNFKGRAEVTKVGDGGSIAGAEFDLFQIVDGEKQLERHIVVPENGKLDLDNLGAGSYQLNETKAAKGYIINSQPIYFVVNENDDENPIVDNLDFENYQIAIEGKKVDADGNGLANAVYEVYKATPDNDPIGEPLQVTNEAGKLSTDIVSNEAGEIHASGLEIGHYVLVEKTAPAGYIKDSTPHPFDIKEQQGKPENVQLGNFVNYKGSAKLLKVNEHGDPLSGAEFKVVDDQGETVKAGLTSDQSGQVTITDLAPGKYQFIETKAPKGYIRNNKAIDFQVNATQHGKPQVVQTDKLVNYQGSAELNKVDEQNKPLQGAVFNVTKENGKVVKKGLTSSRTGKVSAKDLAPGTYAFVETKAPKGYTLSKSKAVFTITTETSGKPVQVEAGKFINKKSPSDPGHPSDPSDPGSPHDNQHQGTKPNHHGWLPHTGDLLENRFVLFGVLLLLLGAGTYFIRKRHKN